MLKKKEISEDVKEYYGEIIQDSSDLRTSACCTHDSMPHYLRALVGNIHPQVRSRFYGCGSPIPLALTGCRVIDLGCGTGRDVYLLSQLVGEEGHVIGVDMTEKQINLASETVDFHTQKFGYKKPNVSFHLGRIEDLRKLGIEDNSIDLVTSNCVINLAERKEAVFSEIFRVLKPGGELYFSDVLANRRIPEELRHDQILSGECLAGAMYIEDFRRMLRNLDCLDYRVNGSRLLSINDEEINNKIGMVDLYSMTIRTFKCDFEDICENYGHVAWYKGTIEQSPHEFRIDDHHLFKTGIPYTICGNTARMLTDTRLKAHFRVEGDFSTHYGPFDCGGAASPVSSTSQTPDEGESCC